MLMKNEELRMKNEELEMKISERKICTAG